MRSDSSESDHNHPLFLAICVLGLLLVVSTLSSVLMFDFRSTGEYTGPIYSAPTPIPSIIVVSSPFADAGPAPNIPFESGRVFVFNADGSPRWYKYGTAGDYQYMGWSLDTTPDVDADGFPEIITGSPWFHQQTGRIDLYSGKTGSWICGTDAPTGQSTNTFFGASVSGAGKMNADSIPDFIVGAPFEDNAIPSQNIGKVHSLSSNNCGINSVRNGLGVNDFFGKSILSGRRVLLNNDSQVDFLAQAIEFIPPVTRLGRVFAISGGDRAVLWNVEGDLTGVGGPNPENYFGHSMATIGDIDNDGKIDFAMGAPGGIIVGSSSPSTGWVTLVSGATGTKIARVPGENLHDMFGFSVAGLGDNDRDGRFEFAVGAVDYASSGLSYRGKVYVYETDAQGNLSLIWSSMGEFAGDNYGFSLAGVKDMDGDSHNELVIGAIKYDGIVGADSGKVYVVDAFTGATKWTHEGPATGGSAGYEFGYDVSGTSIWG